jgi:type IV secretory pathway VirB10-like protein
LLVFPAAILIWVVPSQGLAAQPSEFSRTAEPAPQSAATPPPPAPMVPPKTPKPAWTDATSGASPPVADALPPPSAGSPQAPVVPEPPPVDPQVEAMADIPHFAVGAGAHVAFGSAPAVALGARVSAEIATGRWSLGLEGRYDLPASAQTSEGGTARTSLAGASFVPCIRAKGTWACGVVLASRVKIDGRDASGATASDAEEQPRIGARLEMHLSLPLNFALRIGAEALAHPVAFQLVANGHRVFKSSVVSTTLGPTLVRAF